MAKAYPLLRSRLCKPTYGTSGSRAHNSVPFCALAWWAHQFLVGESRHGTLSGPTPAVEEVIPIARSVLARKSRSQAASRHPIDFVSGVVLCTVAPGRGAGSNGANNMEVSIVSVH